jgi:hypothetical protein
VNWIVHYLWLIPALPLAAAALTALAPQSQRKFAASLAVGSMAIALVLACFAITEAIQRSWAGAAGR